MKKPGPYLRSRPSGYCYHSTICRYKTETLITKWRTAWGNPQQRRTIAYELSFRDPELAIAEVRGLLGGPAETKGKKTSLLCLHHVADAALARELFQTDGFDVDALHLAAFSVLLDDLLERASSLDDDAIELGLRKLGFLAGAMANPIVDGPAGSEAYRTSPDRYTQVLVRFLSAAFGLPAFSKWRTDLAHHLRRCFAREGYRFLLQCWARGELRAVEAFAAVSRLDWENAVAVLGQAEIERLVTAFVAELREPERPFEEEAIDNGFLPSCAKDFPAAVRRRIALAFLDAPRLRSRHEAAVALLLPDGLESARHVVLRFASLDDLLVTRAAAMLSYDEAVHTLVGGGADPTHAALLRHPDRPRDPKLVEEALQLVATDPKEACERLAWIVADRKHPRRDEAMERLLALASAASPNRLRRLALYQLGELGDARATPALSAALTDPELQDALFLVVSALARAGDRRAIPALEQLGKEKPDVGAREALAAILSRA